MQLDVRTPRGASVPPDAAEVAAIVLALATSWQPRARREELAPSRWRRAARRYDGHDRPDGRQRYEPFERRA